MKGMNGRIFHKLICIKENIHNKVGDIVDGFDYLTNEEWRRIVIIPVDSLTLENALENGYTYRTTYENFITLAEYRDKQINDIIYDDIEG